MRSPAIGRALAMLRLVCSAQIPAIEAGVAVTLKYWDMKRNRAAGSGGGVFGGIEVSVAMSSSYRQGGLAAALLTDAVELFCGNSKPRNERLGDVIARMR
jgi:hypothetical protein